MVLILPKDKIMFCPVTGFQNYLVVAALAVSIGSFMPATAEGPGTRAEGTKRIGTQPEGYSVCVWTECVCSI